MAEITWIKLKTDMFDSTKIRLIEKLPEGDTILVIWIKLLTAAGKANSNGYIMLTENIPMNVEEMAVVFDRPLNTVRLALEAFKRYGMVEVDENEIIRIANWEKHQNIDGMAKIREQNRLRKQKERERKKALSAPKNDNEQPCHVTVTPSHATETDLDLDKDLDKDKDKDKETDKDIEGQSVGQSLQHTDNDFLAIRNLFEQNVRVATFKDCEKINEAMEFYETPLILEAVKAGASYARSFNYILGILDNWRKEFNVKTYADWELKIQRKGERSNGINSKRNEQYSNTEYDGLSL